MLNLSDRTLPKFTWQRRLSRRNFQAQTTFVLRDEKKGINLAVEWSKKKKEKSQIKDKTKMLKLYWYIPETHKG